MGDIGILKRRPSGWTAGHARPRHHRTYEPARGPEDGEGSALDPSEWVLLMDATWEVHVPGWAPYEVQVAGRKVPQWVRSSSLGGKGKRYWSVKLRETHGLQADVGVPCLVDPTDPRRVWFDWDAGYELHVPAWRRQSGIRTGIAERKGGIDGLLNRLNPLRTRLDPRDDHHVDAAIAAEQAEWDRATAEGELLIRALNLGFRPPKPEEQHQVMDHVRWCLHTIEHGRRVPATVVAIAPTGGTICRTPVYELHHDVADDGGPPRRVVHHEVMNDAWAGRLVAGTAITVALAADDPNRLALDVPAAP